MTRTLILNSLLLLSLLLCPAMALAHSSSNAYLDVTFDGSTLGGSLAVTLLDLEYELNLDSNLDGKITWGEIRKQRSAIESWALKGLTFSLQNTDSSISLPCSMSFLSPQLDQRGNGNYLLLNFIAECDTTKVDTLSGLAPRIQYGLLLSSDKGHRGIAKIASGKRQDVFVFSPENREWKDDSSISEGDSQHGSSFLLMIQEGVWHIWTGYDHLLFLIALLLPSVFVFSNKVRAPAERFSQVFYSVLKVVTAFTLAHSVTLILASAEIISLPSKPVEVCIAASVLLAALNNLFRWVDEAKLWGVAFLFGLIHGFGFAGVMLEAGVQGKLLLTSILAFNLGVEAGQLAIVLLFLPLAFLLRRRKSYHIAVYQFGSLGIAFLAAIWIFERIS